MKRIKHILSLLKELLLYSMANREFWMFPLVLLLLAIALAVMVTQVLSPFMYTIF